MFELACIRCMPGLGIARRALEEAVRYAQERRQHGKVIAGHQLICAMLAEMATSVDAARLLTYRTASMIRSRCAGRDGSRDGEWGAAVHAEVLLRNGQAVTAEELIALAKAKLGSYKAPTSLTFVDELPTSVVGKVLRRKVKEKYWQGMDRKVS